jgi:hypothetical protein
MASISAVVPLRRDADIVVQPLGSVCTSSDAPGSRVEDELSLAPPAQKSVPHFVQQFPSSGTLLEFSKVPC